MDRPPKKVALKKAWRWPQLPRLYPTVAEERRFRELKERYGLKDST